MPSTIHLVVADITTLSVDAIVNAANPSLLGGGGVDGAIHRAAGPQLRAACADLGGCTTGDAKLTPGFGLPARYIVHTVGPVWAAGDAGQARLLASCYRRAFGIADEVGARSLAYPSISTGAYGYPIAEAAQIAVSTLRETAQTARSLEILVLCCYSPSDAVYYRAALAGP
ncbi:MAG: O-acetyl-ADP-ribose deacetylase [Chromatiaceae bacterium]|jgi:O-acetyl-ADP-ribose deacetylase (regulator of RNase III)